jgi:hypothetical protein
MHLLELETVGECERGMNRIPHNARRLVETGQKPSDEPLATDAANTILSW